MKVIHVTYDPEGYGIGTFLIHLIESQKTNFKDVQVSVAFHTDGPSLDKYRGLGIPVYNLRCSSGRDIRAFFHFCRIFKNHDVVNLHTYSPWAFLAAKTAGKKVVYTFHGSLGLRKKWTDCLVRFYYRSLFNPYCDWITFASKASLARYRAAVDSKLTNERIALFPYGIQIGKIVPVRSREEVRAELLAHRKFLVGTAARMDPAKKLGRLIQAFAYLPRNVDFRLVIMGSGNLHYQTQLMSLVRSCNVQDRVCFLGYRRDVVDIMSALDLFVLPSENEPFGLALLEAMAVGVPSAVFEDGGGAVDILGKSGFIVRNPEDLAKLMQTVKDDGALRQAAANSGRERARRFDIKHSAKHLYRLYTSSPKRSY